MYIVFQKIINDISKIDIDGDSSRPNFVAWTEPPWTPTVAPSRRPPQQSRNPNDTITHKTYTEIITYQILYPSGDLSNRCSNLR